ncbi:ig-like domain repeat protein [Anaeramoeba ignava]|uniref:Ig-like domain repeat protein n=1 Tax=Anaeramoeba ignava TaxID=1746090 RepID=A0A9Q0LJ07_ANAIG|nr:ig-like domain repeat protein [Anaeramoeba ignava]
MNFGLLFFLSFACFFLLIQTQFNETNSLNLPLGIDWVTSSFLDEDAGFLYFLDQRNTDETYLWKYDMNTLDILNYTEIGVDCYGEYGAIDTVNKLLYVAKYYSGSQFFKIDLNTMQVVDNITLTVPSGNHAVRVEIDVVNQKAYVGYQNPIYVVKVDLASFTEGSNLTLSNDKMTGSVIDVDNGILYVSTDSNSGNNATIYKIDLSTFTQVDSLLVSLSGVAYLKCGVIDSTNQMMYFGTNQWPTKIVKINSADFTSVGSVTTTLGGDCYGAGIDETNGFAYFLNSYYIYKLTLASFTVTGSVDFDSFWLDSMVLDSSAGNAYITSGLAQVIQVNLPSLTEGNKSNSIVYTDPEFIFIDEPNQIAYIYFENLGGIISKIDLQSFSLVDYLIIELNESMDYGEIDTTNGFIYLFPYHEDLDIIKIRLSNFTFDGIVTVATDTSIYGTSFDSQNQVLYVEIYNDTESEYYLAKITCPDLQIIDSLLLDNLNVYKMHLDSSHGYLYILLKNNSASSSKYFIFQYQTSPLNQIGSVDLTQYYVSKSVLDKTHQFIYFGDYDYDVYYYFIYRVDLVTMQVMSGSLYTESEDLYGSFMSPNDDWVYFVVDYYNSDTDEYEGAILQIEASSNQLISNTTFDSEFLYGYLYASDQSKNYGYLLDYYSTPVTLYQLPFGDLPPSSSQQILFSFLIFGIMILILGLF